MNIKNDPLSLLSLYISCLQGSGPSALRRIADFVGGQATDELLQVLCTQATGTFFCVAYLMIARSLHGLSGLRFRIFPGKEGLWAIYERGGEHAKRVG